MDRLTGHFQRAVRLWLRTAELRQRAAIGEQVMDAIELGVVAIPDAGDMKYANRLAEARLREGKLLVMRQGKLAAKGLGAPGLSDIGTCYVTVLPVGSSGPLALRIHPATLLVLIGHARRRRTITVQQLVVIFGLTPAEARLARSQSGGESMAAYAEANDVSINTLKTQLKSVFAKTGTTRQAELAQMIAIIPVVRQEPAEGTRQVIR